MLRILLKLSELLFKGNDVDRWEKGSKAWPEFLGSIKLKNLKKISNKARFPPIGTLSAEVL